MCKQYKPFVNLHMHTSWSLLDGCGHINKYIDKALQYGHPALCVTDHGTASAWFDLWREIKRKNEQLKQQGSDKQLKPIFGEEFYACLNPQDRTPNRKRRWVERDKHQSVIVKDGKGYQNACRLNYLAYTQGFYYKPRISYDQLFEYSEGLIVTTGCMVSIFNQIITNGSEKEAEEWFVKFAKHFGEDFYGEIQFNEIKDDNEKYDGINQKRIDDFILHMCQKHGIKHVIGGDTHYADKEDARLQDIVINVGQNRNKKEIKQNVQSFIHARKLYYHSSQDYYDFNEQLGYNYDKDIIDKAFDNSLEVYDKANFEFDTDKINFPKYQHPTRQDESNYDILYDMVEEGLVKRINERKNRGEEFTAEKIDEYKERLDMEMQVIDEKQIVDYFLIVQDVLNWSKQNDIWAGPARGSAAGCLVSYAIGITEIDPIKFDLYFERFQNPQRESLPDIDVDVMNGSRDKIREYLEERYGKDSVLGVVTFQLYHAKSALQDATRGLGKDTGHTSTLMREINKLSIPYIHSRPWWSPQVEGNDADDDDDVVKETLSIDGVDGKIMNLRGFFDTILEIEEKTPRSYAPTVITWIEENEDTIRWADKLLGQVKNLGTHAGGILITPGPVYDHIPVARGSGEVVTGFKEADGSSKDLSALGLLKLDILGLRTLNVIKGCIDDIKRDLNKDIVDDVRYVDLEDENILKKYAEANNVGIFQMEHGASDLIKEIKPDSFWDLVAINGINRPGPKETFGPLYGEWKKHHQNGEEEKREEHDMYPKLDFMREVTKRTYGCLIFQEQLMLMVKEAAGFNLGEADHFRRMLGWRKDNPKYYLLEQYFDKLRSGMKNNGYSDDDVDYFVDYAKKFVGYSFNLSHAVSYGYLAMQTLYLKTYYPEYFYANMLNFEPSSNYQTVIADAMTSGIEILPPSITKSEYKFTVEGEKQVRIGLKAIKGFGETAYNELREIGVEQSEDIGEILSKPFKKFNKKAIEALADAGALDEFGVAREKILHARELFKNKKIQTWFTRKRKPLTIDTMPECLYQFPEKKAFEFVDEVKDQEQPWKGFVKKLLPYIDANPLTDGEKEDRARKVLEISLSVAKQLSVLKEVAHECNQSDEHPNLTAISERSNDKDLCYWFLLGSEKRKTKHGKPYLVLDITDHNMTVKAKCWKVEKFTIGEAYVSQLKHDKFGYTVVQNASLQRLEL